VSESRARESGRFEGECGQGNSPAGRGKRVSQGETLKEVKKDPENRIKIIPRSQKNAAASGDRTCGSDSGKGGSKKSKSKLVSKVVSGNKKKKKASRQDPVVQDRKTQRP